MAAPYHPTLSSSQPDVRLIQRMAFVHYVLLGAVALVAGTVLLAWLLPPFAELLPPRWSQMKVNTALCVLLVVCALKLSQPKRSDRALLCSRVTAILVLLLAFDALAEHLMGLRTGIGTLLAADGLSPKSGLMSMQTSIFFALFGATLVAARERKSRLSAVVDLLTFSLLVVTLVIVAGYAFGAAGLFSQSEYTRTSPQTLVCMGLLTTVQIGMRAEYGVFSVLVGVGIGSRIARAILPIALILPFLFAMSGAYASASGWLATPYSAALSAALTALVLFAVLLFTAWRINDLERDLRDMSLSDELTRIYNRRGFQLLGEQALREAHRSHLPLTVLFFDLDGLKKANDSFGHDVGSRFLVDVADLLRAVFRDADIVARVGGDEFAVITHSTGAEAIARLRIATDEKNRSAGREYLISYSVGTASSSANRDESLADLVQRADAEMYEDKRTKKLRPPEAASARAANALKLSEAA